MIILSIETSTKYASASLLKDNQIVDFESVDNRFKHAETVLPMVSNILKRNDYSIDDVELFAVDVGPGSFTGIRIGISVIDAFSYVSGKKILPVCSLDALYTSVDEREIKTVCTLIDARNDNVYAKIFKNGTVTLQAGAYSINDLKAYCDDNTVFVGDISIVGNCNNEQKKYPDASDIGLWAFEHKNLAVNSVKALYLRPSQAERLKQDK